MKTTEEHIEIADHVKHIPSGEEWIVARANDKYIWPCGWPETRALKIDCVLMKKSDAAEKEALIESLKKLPSSDPRCFLRHENENN